MKELFIYLTLLMTGSKVTFAQIPNQSFEQSNAGVLTHWTTLPEVTITNAAKGGSQALLLKPTVDQDNVDLLTSGTFEQEFIPLANLTVASTFNFWYKGDFAAWERLYVLIQLKKGDNIYAVGAAEFSHSQTEYTKATINLVKNPLVANADSIAVRFNIRSQHGSGISGNSEILLDELSLNGSTPTGVENKYLTAAMLIKQSNHETINVTLSGIDNSPADIEVLDMTGKTVYSKGFITENGHTFNTNGWPKGIYVVQVKVGQKRLCKKIMV